MPKRNHSKPVRENRIAPPPRYRCPKCRHESEGDAFALTITSTIPTPAIGVYCLRCYLEWLAANLPRLEELP